MIIPEFLEHGDYIGVTAPSDGVIKELKVKRLKNAKLNMRNAGYEIITTENVFTSNEHGVSASAEDRARHFMNLIKNDSVKAIYAVSGGDYLMEILDLLDWDMIKNNPKWFQGFSDNTGLVYPLVTKCDIASIYGCHFGDFGMKPWGKSVKDALGLINGTQKSFESYEYHEDDFHDYETGYEDYAKDKKVCWVNGQGESKIELKGRLIGGCLDVITFLLGTEYDGGLEFVEKYKEDGIIWALETFDMNEVVMITHLWQMKKLGYFNNVSGFVFGRPCMYTSFSGDEYKDAVMSILGDLNVPIIFDADITHRGPSIPFVMGAKVRIISENSKGIVEYI